MLTNSNPVTYNMAMPGLSKKQIRLVRKHLYRMPPEEAARKLNLPLTLVNTYAEKHPPHRTGETKPDSSIPVRTIQDLKQLITGSMGIIILLVLVTAGIYVNVLPGELLFDDVAYLGNNPAISTPGFIIQSPLTMGKALVNWITYLASGGAPWAYHAVNIVFHTGTVIAVFILAGLLSGRPAAIIAASLTVVHPIFTESVSWIGGGGYAMYTFWFILSLVFFVISKSGRRWTVVSVICLALSLVTSEKALALPLAYPVLEHLRRGLKKNWLGLVPYLAVTALWGEYVFIFSGYFATRVETFNTWYDRTAYFNPLVHIPTAVSTYLQILAWPKDLTFFYTQLNYTVTEYIIRLIVFIIATGLTILAYRKNKTVFFLITVCFLSLLPSFSPLVISWHVAERYFYTGAVALIIIAALGVDRLLIAKPKLRKPIIIGITIAIVGLGLRTMLRNRDWISQESITRATIRTSPNDARTQNNMGNIYFRNGELDRAEESYNRALTLTSIRFRRSGIFFNLGLIYDKRGQMPRAYGYYRQAIESDPKNQDPYKRMSSVAYDRGEYTVAKETLELAISNGIRIPFFYTNLGAVYDKLGNRPKALEMLRESLQLDPKNAYTLERLKKIEAN